MPLLLFFSLANSLSSESSSQLLSNEWPVSVCVSVSLVPRRYRVFYCTVAGDNLSNVRFLQSNALFVVQSPDPARHAVGCVR